MRVWVHVRTLVVGLSVVNVCMLVKMTLQMLNKEFSAANVKKSNTLTVCHSTVWKGKKSGNFVIVGIGRPVIIW